MNEQLINELKQINESLRDIQSVLFVLTKHIHAGNKIAQGNPLPYADVDNQLMAETAITTRENPIQFCESCQHYSTSKKECYLDREGACLNPSRNRCGLYIPSTRGGKLK